jgi:hypothetical protein
MVCMCSTGVMIYDEGGGDVEMVVFAVHMGGLTLCMYVVCVCLC